MDFSSYLKNIAHSVSQAFQTGYDYVQSGKLEQNFRDLQTCDWNLSICMNFRAGNQLGQTLMGNRKINTLWAYPQKSQTPFSK